MTTTASSSSDPPTPSSIEIARQGDVILKLGHFDKPAGSLLVSSSILSVASPVFRAMFDGRFSEGQGLSSTTPREVPLPGDDPANMTMLCKILHYQLDDISVELDLNTMADMAILCDKYDCTDALRPWWMFWISRWIGIPGIPGYEKLLFITYVLDLPHDFFQVTQSLVRDCKDDIRIDIASHGHDLLPMRVLDRILQEQRRTQALALSYLHNGRMMKLLKSEDCTKAQRIYTSYLRTLIELKIFPDRPIPLAQYYRGAQELPTKYKYIYDKNCNKQERICPCNSAYEIIDQIINNLEMLFVSVEGQCLDCLLEEMGRASQGCRVQHE